MDSYGWFIVGWLGTVIVIFVLPTGLGNWDFSVLMHRVVVADVPRKLIIHFL